MVMRLKAAEYEKATGREIKISKSRSIMASHELCGMQQAPSSLCA
jgi:hypothetical protein